MSNAWLTEGETDGETEECKGRQTEKENCGKVENRHQKGDAGIWTACRTRRGQVGEQEEDRLEDKKRTGWRTRRGQAEDKKRTGWRTRRGQAGGQEEDRLENKMRTGWMTRRGKAGELEEDRLEDKKRTGWRKRRGQAGGQ
jgi:hypothetical protein